MTESLQAHTHILTQYPYNPPRSRQGQLQRQSLEIMNLPFERMIKAKWRDEIGIKLALGVFLVTTSNTFVSFKRDFSLNIHEFQLSHEGVSEVSEQAHERSERSERS